MTEPTYQNFLNEYANWSGLKKIFITFDVDWAPDYMIDKLCKEGRHEIGTHINLAPHSTQGDSVETIVDAFTSTYPRICGNRFHLLHYSYRDLISLGKSGFLYDVSSFLLNQNFTLPAWHPDLNMVLLTYIWEDGPCENSGMPMTLDSINLDSPGIKIINFHPLNVYLNGEDAENRMSLLEHEESLFECSQRIADKYRSTGPGAENILVELLNKMKEHECTSGRLTDLAESFQSVMGNNIHPTSIHSKRKGQR
jgi:hypothetical protein